ncbi:hypothetical protein JCM3774_001033 [Rhodotorula dairenensis]
MGGFVSTAAQTAVSALPSLAALRAAHAHSDAPGSRCASPAGGAAPSYADVLDVLEILQQLRLPVELAIDILDAAEYYPAVTAQWTGNQVASAGPRGDLARATVLVTPQLPAITGAPEHYVKRVSVWTDSRDQGFSSFAEFRGTRKGSSSWFDLVLLRRPSDATAPTRRNPVETLPGCSAGQTPPQHESDLRVVASIRLHCNIHASHIFSQYITTLPRPPSPPELAGDEEDAPSEPEDDGTEFLAQILPGDRLAVVACAQYPMWVNAVRGCAIKVEIKAI